MSVARPRIRCLALAGAVAGCAAPPPPLPPPTVGSPAPPVERALAVAAGESACALAGRAGVDVDALRAANGVDGPPHAPLPVRRVRLPDAPLRHRIRTGETLTQLARWYGVPAAALASHNALAEPDRILADTWLAIPPGARTGCPPPPPVRAQAPASHPTRTRAPAAGPVEPGPSPRQTQPPTRPARTEPAAPAASPDRAALARADAALARAGRHYEAADFEAALAESEAALRALPAHARDGASTERRARARWLAGLANAGLGRREAAIASLHEALALRPSLRDDASVSPRILGLLEEAER